MADQTFGATDDAFGATIELVSAYVSGSADRPGPQEFQALILATYSTLSGLTGGGAAPVKGAKDHTKTKAEIKKSVGPERLTSFIDGKNYASLKRHLTTNGYTPETYRKTFGLPGDYPMTHPAYSARRSELAKSLGLGQARRKLKGAAKGMTRASR